MSRDQQLENEIQAKGLTAQRITPADVEKSIASEWFFTAAQGAAFAAVGQHDNAIPDGLGHVTICVLIMRNGMKIVGSNTGSISPENFDRELAQKLARENATDQIWPLLGYELRTRRSAGLPGGQYYAADGTLMNANGTRSIFDDVDK